MSQKEAYIDVVELCGILQCLGFHVKSIDTHVDKNTSTSHDGARTVIVDCQTSGLHVVLENGNLSCSCPAIASQQNSGIWQVSGVAGGKQLDKEFGSSILGSLPKDHRERLTRQLQDIARCIKQHNETEADRQRDGIANRSASMIDMKTPPKRLELKPDTPTRYRSLDTLTGSKQADTLPEPGPLAKILDNKHDSQTQSMCQRQSTYTLSSTPDSSRRRNKTSSPIRRLSSTVLDSLLAAEKTAEELRSNLSNVIKELTEDGRYDSSSSLALDVSKISILKAPDSSRIQFASSPNLTGPGFHDELTRRLQGIESASTSNLATKLSAKDPKTSKLRRISPKIFKSNSMSSKIDKDKQNNNNKSSKFNSLFKPKIVTPVRAGSVNLNSEASPNLSGSKKKFSHIKSTIPRPTATASKKE
ncbi:uncharacterized protein LOC112044611 [Bicyclus anynana]|uniref:Uncharacterized protein LOC112044611 n=1 Tax=Bicyclus anynana TaxID=110368 RepID=A0A6J1MTN3_BICAN|nr:uncharacterized protein LOC112044611 [Bicyclus anynana]